MTEQRYTVPEEGLKAVVDAHMIKWEHLNDAYRDSAMGKLQEQLFIEEQKEDLEAFIRWQSENPGVPTKEQSDALKDEYYSSVSNSRSEFSWCAEEWQRRMYLAPEPECLHRGEFKCEGCGASFSVGCKKAPEPEVATVPQYIVDLRQIRYDLAERPERTSLNLIVERLEDVLCALGDAPPGKQPEPERKDGDVEWNADHSAPIGIWYKGKISYSSPLGQNLMGKEVGKEFNFMAGSKKVKVKILEIK